MASMGLVVKADARLEVERGEPRRGVRLLWGPRVERLEVLRTRAVTVWLWVRAERVVRWPVRPEAPRMRRCIVRSWGLRMGCVGLWCSLWSQLGVDVWIG